MDEDVHLKLLIPCVAAGAIIGKGGEAVESIKRQTGARLKMSKANDFYPGTTERVCLIVGTIKACMQLSDYIMKKISERTDPPSPVSHPVSTTTTCLPAHLERHNQVKILVPNSTAGVIIGKSGSFIKKIKEMSGAFVQISQRPKGLKLMERCIIITGDMDERRLALSMVLSKIAEDPDSASCPNCSYVQIHEPVASAYPTGSPYAVNTNESQPSVPYTATNLPYVDADPSCVKMDLAPTAPMYPPFLFGPPIQNSDFCSTTPGYQEIPTFIPVDDTLLPNPSYLPAIANAMGTFTVTPPQHLSGSKLVALPSPYSPPVAWLTTNTFPFGQYQGPSSLVPSEFLASPTTQCGSLLPSLLGFPSADSLATAARLLQTYGVVDGCSASVPNSTPSSSLPVFSPSVHALRGPSLNGYTSSHDFTPHPLVDECSMTAMSSHARYWSGGSTDSALTESFASIRLHSSVDDRLPDGIHSPVTRPQSCSLTTSNSVGSAGEPHPSVQFGGHSTTADETVFSKSILCSPSVCQTPILPTVISSCYSDSYLSHRSPVQATPIYSTQVGHGVLNAGPVCSVNTIGLATSAEGPVYCVPPTFSSGYAPNSLQFLCFHPPPLSSSVNNCFTTSDVPSSSFSSSIVPNGIQPPYSNTTQTSSGGLLIVGTTQQVKNALSAMHLNPRLLSDISSASSNQTSSGRASVNTLANHFATSFPPDAPLRLDLIQPHHPPETALPQTSLGQTTTR
ncbi:RNA-binding protein Nova-1 [Clonorchis sinensis]|uniref:RNA-binding protein Nova-1 n=1 Tax=Clonorchis sinensis TaxID=79923 RepID=A0A8T1MHP2_CLOSI|nr:RNA-binding protein Nova-1 [Clonorchis sinensis]